MRISQIGIFDKDFCRLNNNKVSRKYNNYNNSFSNVSFEAARVDKGLERFYEANLKRLPTTLKLYLDGLVDKFSLTPLQAQKNAYAKLNEAKSIEDIQRLFPDEELFIYLKQPEKTKATNGLLGIYREFKEIYENGILKTGDDLSVYLLKKIFMDSKTIDEINDDLDKDLLEDIKQEFKRRNPDSDYVKSSTLKAIGIFLPDTAFQNSLKFTREGYSDSFGITVSQAQLKYWNSLDDDKKFEILSKRCIGRDNWWNALSRDEKLEYAAGIDSDDDLYKNYKKFVNDKRNESALSEEKQQGLLHHKNKIRVGSNLKDKDIFVLWMKKNLEKFYTSLSEADKDSVHIKRVRRLTVRWQEMTPEEKTELINKMRAGREPLKFAMIDAWNHSKELIIELSEFLKSQQILKPLDLIYSSEEFSEFQSKIMTEFWANHRDLAERFGDAIKTAQARVENAISKGQFEDLKQEIYRDRAYRIKVIKHEQRQEYEKIKSAELKAKELIQEGENAKTLDYKTEFANAYKNSLNGKRILPNEYVEDMVRVMLKKFPQNTIEQYTKSIESKSDIPDSVKKAFYDAAQEFDFRTERYQRALEAAIANVICSTGADPFLYGQNTDFLINILEAFVESPKYKKNKTIIPKIQMLYKEYKKELTSDEAEDILSNYFILKEENDDYSSKRQLLIDYIKSYGRSALILFSPKSAFNAGVKTHFNSKFINLIPKELNDTFIPILKNSDSILEEGKIHDVMGQVAKRFDFLPKDAINAYTQTASKVIKIFSASEMESEYTVDNFRRIMAKTTNDNSLKFLMIPKWMADKNNKIKLLSLEQALADELYRITKEVRMYQLDLEQLLCICEKLSSKKSLGQTIEMKSDDGEITILASEKPRLNIVKLKYHEYENELKSRQNDIFRLNDIKDEEELLYALNPDETKEDIDKCTSIRIKGYLY